MELWRASGSVVMRAEEGEREWIRVLREGLMDLLKPSFVIEERNSSAEVLSEERRRFSIDGMKNFSGFSCSRKGGREGRRRRW